MESQKEIKERYALKCKEMAARYALDMSIAILRDKCVEDWGKRNEPKLSTICTDLAKLQRLAKAVRTVWDPKRTITPDDKA